MESDNVFSLVSEDLLRDFPLDELLEQMNVTEQHALELVLEKYLYDPDLPAFIQTRIMEFEQKEYEHNDA